MSRQRLGPSLGGKGNPMRRILILLLTVIAIPFAESASATPMQEELSFAFDPAESALVSIPIADIACFYCFQYDLHSIIDPQQSRPPGDDLASSLLPAQPSELLHPR
jgi:hypothetical protein